MTYKFNVWGVLFNVRVGFLMIRMLDSFISHDISRPIHHVVKIPILLISPNNLDVKIVGWF